MSEPIKIDLDTLNADDAVNLVGSLYADLGDDATTLLADHVEQMNSVQEYVSALVAQTLALNSELNKAKQTIADLKEANVKYMMQQVKREPDKPDDVQEIDDISDALDAIDVD